MHGLRSGYLTSRNSQFGESVSLSVSLNLDKLFGMLLYYKEGACALQEFFHGLEGDITLRVYYYIKL